MVLKIVLATLLLCPCLSLGEAEVCSCQTESLCVESQAYLYDL